MQKGGGMLLSVGHLICNIFWFLHSRKKIDNEPHIATITFREAERLDMIFLLQNLRV